MLTDNVLISVLIFFISCGVLWMVISQIQNSSISNRFKRFVIYLGIVIIFFIVVLIFDHHSANHIALNA